MYPEESPVPWGSPPALGGASPCSPWSATLVHRGKCESCAASGSSSPHWWSCHLPRCPERGEPDKTHTLRGCEKGKAINMARSMHLSTFIYLFILCMYWCYGWVCVSMNVPQHMWEVRGQLLGISPPFVPCGFWGRNSGRQTWQKMPSPAKLFH